MSWVDRVRIAAVRPVSAASVSAFRIAFGLCAALVPARFLLRGWVDALYLDPTYHFTYPFLSWVRPLPAAGMYALFVLLIVAGIGIAVGRHLRTWAVIFTLGFAYIEAIDVTTYLNHYELVTLVGALCCVLPIGSGRSSLPVGVIWLLRFQLAVVYVFAGIGKLDADWLLRGEPLHTWLVGRQDFAVVGPWLEYVWVAVVLSWAGAIFDMTIVGWLLWRRTRLVAYVAVVAFHLVTGWLFPGIGAFPLVMIVLTPIFFEPDWPMRLAARASREPGTDLPPIVAAPARHRWVMAAALLWVAVQIVVPLRHLAYPGDVRWTEEGYRWSWRVLLSEKEGIVTFHVAAPGSSGARTMYPSDELRPHQVRYLSTRPDLIRQFAHHLADVEEAGGRSRPQVTADAWVTINGRPVTQLIDPDADLAAESTGPWPSPSISPSPLG